MRFKIDTQIEDVLIKNGFRKTQNNSLYKTIKKLKNKVIIVRVANHYKHKDFNNEILINYIVKNNNDIKRVVKKLIKNKIIMEVARWKI